MTPIFKPDDFLPILELIDIGSLSKLPEDRAAQIANTKLNALIESWPTVFGNPTTDTWSLSRKFYSTKKAKMAFIEEIVKEPELCKHELIRPNVSYRMAVDQAGNEYYTHLNKCKQCGAELQATWSAI